MNPKTKQKEADIMKKLASILLAVIMTLALAGAAWAEEIPQAEGGKKFEGNWAKMNGLIEIVYEEEGYRVAVDLFNQEDNTGVLWQYSCFYNEEKDALLSFSSSKSAYSLNPDTLDKTLAEPEYEGIDEDAAISVFALTQDGALEWKDGHENRGQDLLFTRIGSFEGLWRNEAENIYAEFHWQGLLDENQFCYNVYIAQGEKECHLIGMYSPETMKLACYDTAAIPAESTEGYLTAQNEGKPYQAVFTDLGGGQAQYETENGVFTLEYDILGPES